MVREAMMSSPLLLWWISIVITSKWQDIVQEAAQSTPRCLTICIRSSWSKDQFNMMDWQALKHCLLGMPQVHCLSNGRLLNGLLNTNMQNCRYYNSSDLCTHCGRESETFVHVISCLNSEVSLHRIQAQETLWAS